MSFGQRVKELRKKRNLTQDELAKSMGISRSYLSDIENDRKNPSLKTIQNLAEKLDADISYLVTGKSIAEENKRLREALEFYADEKSWMNREVTILMDGEPTDVEDCPAIFDDGGNIARKALEG